MTKQEKLERARSSNNSQALARIFADFASSWANDLRKELEKRSPSLTDVRFYLSELETRVIDLRRYVERIS